MRVWLIRTPRDRGAHPMKAHVHSRTAAQAYFRAPLACLAVLVAAATGFLPERARAQQAAVSPTATAVLTYRDEAVGKLVRRGGGFVGAPNWVTDLIRGQPGPEQHAFLSVPVTPRYDRVGGSESTYVAVLDVGEPNLS